jgi:inhibitor of cysteine peptidase
MKNKVLFLVLILTTVCLIVPLYIENMTVRGETELKRFSSYEELKTFVKTRTYSYLYFGDRRNGWNGWSSWSGTRAMLFTQSPSPLESLDSMTSDSDAYFLSPEYSKTNTQVEGVDEPDFIKTDGEYIYIASGKNVTILKVYPPEEAEILSQIKLDGAVDGIFINGDKMVVFEGGYYQTFWPSIKVYDVSNRASPILTRNVTYNGYYFDARMIGDYAYAIIYENVYANETWVALPKIYFNGEVKEIDATEIYYSNASNTYSTFTTIVAVNTQNDAEEPTKKTIMLGAASNIFVSMNNIYLTFQAEGEPKPSSPAQTLPISEPVWGTAIHRVHIEDGEIECVASGHVPGYVLNQFSMDEYNGYFRIATTTGEIWASGQAASRNHVYVLDMSLKIVGSLENLAEGEKIHSARFMGNRCYLVTFKKIDPLFVIDLSDPSDPRVLGQLKIPGYSDYLHPYDENHIIGVGKDTVEGEGGNFAWYQGVKISFFDVSDVEHPQEMDKYIIGDRGTDSSVLWDHKAFLFDRSKSLLVIPVLVAESEAIGVPPWTCGGYVFQGAYVFNITLNKGLVLKGRITHLENAPEQLKNLYCFDYSYFVERSLYIDNVLYTISSKKIKMNSLEDLAEINEIELP